MDALIEHVLMDVADVVVRVQAQVLDVGVGVDGREEGVGFLGQQEEQPEQDLPYFEDVVRLHIVECGRELQQFLAQ